MSRTIYSVESGEYSAHRVHALFDTEAGAEAHAARLNEGRDPGWYDQAQVRTFTLYAEGEQPERVTQYERVDDTTLEREGHNRAFSNEVWDYELEEARYAKVWAPDDRRSWTAIHVVTSGRSEAEVAKVHQDAVARAKAEAAGIA